MSNLTHRVPDSSIHQNSHGVSLTDLSEGDTQPASIDDRVIRVTIRSANRRDNSYLIEYNSPSGMKTAALTGDDFYPEVDELHYGMSDTEFDELRPCDPVQVYFEFDPKAPMTCYIESTNTTTRYARVAATPENSDTAIARLIPQSQMTTVEPGL